MSLICCIQHNGIAKDFDILALPSKPGKRLHIGKQIEPYTQAVIPKPIDGLSGVQFDLVCSIIGIWSSPTGTTVALNAVISAACATG